MLKKNSMIRYLAITFLCLGLVMDSIAQQVKKGADPDSIKANMQKLKKLEGQWEGEAVYYRGPQRTSLIQSEQVSFKANGAAMLVEGMGKTAEGTTVFQAVALIVFDPGTQKFNIRAVKGEGQFIDTELFVEGDTIWWYLPMPNGGKARNTIILKGDSTWEETGEFSQDGETWHKFLEMKLRRKE